MTRSTVSANDLVGLVVDAWTEALEVAVTTESDFFASGGTSMAAVSIAQNVAAHFHDRDGVEALMLQAVFEQPTLGDVAIVLATFLAEPVSRA